MLMRARVRRSLLCAVAVVALSAAVASPAAQAAETFVPAFSFSGVGSDPGLVQGPAGVAVEGSSGNVFVADSGNGRVQVFDSSGGFLTEFGADEVDAPFDVVVREVLGETVVYVSDPGTGRIVRFESDELLVPSFTPDGSFVSPAGGGGAGRVGSFRSALAVDPASGDLLVGDSGKDIVQRYSPTGVFLGDFDGAGSPDGVFTHLEDVAVDQTGNVFVADAQGGAAMDGSPSRVDRYSSAGVHEAVVRPLAVTGDGLVALDPASGSVLVGDVRPCLFCGPRAVITVLDDATYAQTGSVSVAEAVAPTGLAVDPGSTGRVYMAVDDPYCGGGCGPVGVQAFERKTLPDATLDAPTNVTTTTADLSGTVDPQGNTTTAKFELSTDGGSTWQDLPDGSGEIAICTLDPPAQDCTTPVAVNHTATGLTHSTGYQVRLKALIAGGMANAVSATESFTTETIPAPAVTVAPPDNVTADSADLSGTVDAQGADTTYSFEVSLDGGDWTAIDPDQDGPETIAGSTTGPQPVTAQATDLQPNKPYQQRIVATNPGGQTIETGEPFTTNGQAPTATPGTVGALTHQSARLTAYIDPNNNPTTYQFEYSTNPNFTNATTVPSSGNAGPVDGDGQKIAHQDVDLAPNTTYHWRIHITSSHGTDTASAPRTFNTWPTPQPHQGGVGIDGTRQYELVTTGKGGAGGAVISRDGERVLYSSGFPEDHSNFGGVGVSSWSKRTPTGWQVRSALPDRSIFEGYKNATAVLGSPNLEALTIAATPAVTDLEPSRAFRYEPETGDIQQGAITPSTYAFNSAGQFVASDDQRHAYLLSQPPNNEPGELADIGGPDRVEVGLMPDGSSPVCGVHEFASQLNGTVSSHWVSTDGDRVFFTSRGDDCDGPAHLYMREGGSDGSTTLISGPAIAGPERAATFLQATPDGSRVFFGTAARLDSTDLNERSDVYRYIVGEGSSCLTCVAANASVEIASAAYAASPGVLVSEYGERVYFTSSRVLAPGATTGVRNMYVWRAMDPAAVHFVAPADSMVASGLNLAAITTPDGSVAIFTSGRTELDALTGSNNNGFLQRYRYDDRDGSLVCVSCPPTGATYSLTNFNTSTGVYGVESITPLTVDGRSFFFTTGASLVASDRGGEDAYEWRDGRVALLSGGAGAGFTGLLSASADGRSVLIRGRDKLTADARVEAADELYNVRVGGGFPFVTPSPGCVGDGCQGPVSSRPGGPALGSGGVSRPASPTRVTGCSRLSAGVVRARRMVRRAGVRRRAVAKAGGRERVARLELRRAERKLRLAKRKLAVCRRGGGS